MSSAPNTAEAAMAQAISVGIRSALIDTHTALPGSIVSFDAATQEAEVRLEIPRIARDLEGTETEEPIQNLPDVPVYFQSVAGFAITMPVQAGDECLVFFLERDASAWLAAGGVQAPSTLRIHDYSDAVCLVGLSSVGNRIAGFNGSALEIRNASGNTVLRIGDGDAAIEAPTVTLEGSTVTLGNGIEDLVALLSEALQELSALKVTDPISGALPLEPASLTALLVLKARVDTFKA